MHVPQSLCCRAPCPGTTNFCGATPTNLKKMKWNVWRTPNLNEEQTMTGTRLNWTVSREYVSPSCWHARPCETFVTIIDNHWLRKCDSKVTIFIIRIICHRNLSCQSAEVPWPPTLPGRFMKPVEQGNQGTNRSKAEEKRTQKQRNKTKKQQRKQKQTKQRNKTKKQQWYIYIYIYHISYYDN